MQEQPEPAVAPAYRLDLRAERMTEAELATARRALEILAELRSAGQWESAGTGCSCSRIG